MNDFAKDPWAAWVCAYRNTAEFNDQIYLQFTAALERIPWLKNHRLLIENHHLGFGDRAFHYLWYLLIRELSSLFPSPQIAEIGVYKGQVISLWSLLSAMLSVPLEIFAITPLSAFPAPRTEKFNPSQPGNPLLDGNYFVPADYLQEIKALFSGLALDFQKIRLIVGYSQSAEVLNSLRDQTFHLVYIDGDHSYDRVLADIQNFVPKIVPGGYLVMDDAGYFLPGKIFWKGFEAVSVACQALESFGLYNLLNIGHNRVYWKPYQR